VVMSTLVTFTPSSEAAMASAAADARAIAACVRVCVCACQCACGVLEEGRLSPTLQSTGVLVCV
jgi:hypothetical protein